MHVRRGHGRGCVHLGRGGGGVRVHGGQVVILVTERASIVTAWQRIANTGGAGTRLAPRLGGCSVIDAVAMWRLPCHNIGAAIGPGVTAAPPSLWNGGAIGPGVSKVPSSPWHDGVVDTSGGSVPPSPLHGGVSGPGGLAPYLSPSWGGVAVTGGTAWVLAALQRRSHWPQLPGDTSMRGAGVLAPGRSAAP